MSNLVIQGGTPLLGRVSISGAKNACLPVLSAAILTDKPCVFDNVPFLEDVKTLSQVFSHLGSSCKITQQGLFKIETKAILSHEAPLSLVSKMRASILVLGPLLARTGYAKIAMPGGCSIGDRPIDQHLKGLSALGADIEIEGPFIIAKAKKLQGTHIKLDMPTVTGTEQLMMAASLAEGITTIDNAAKEPEISELAHVLNLMGAQVKGAGTPTLTIQGASSLQGISYTIMPDRIEAGTFLAAVATCGGEIWIDHVNPQDLDIPLQILTQSGLQIHKEKNSIFAKANTRLNSFNLRTEPYPGFPTDLQAQFMAVACTTQGNSKITETIFENRYMHVAELQKMGAKISVEGQIARIQGVEELQGTQVVATDLRASACLVIAGLKAKGTTIVSNLIHLDRGYENIEKKLKNLGANIVRRA